MVEEIDLDHLEVLLIDPSRLLMQPGLEPFRGDDTLEEATILGFLRKLDLDASGIGLTFYLWRLPLVLSI